MPLLLHSIRFREPYDPVSDDTEINGATGLPYGMMMVITDKVDAGDPYTPPSFTSMTVFKTDIIEDWDATKDTHETYYIHPNTWTGNKLQYNVGDTPTIPTNVYNFENTPPDEVARGVVTVVYFTV